VSVSASSARVRAIDLSKPFFQSCNHAPGCLSRRRTKSIDFVNYHARCCP
jgi:hypothetical protein